MTKAWIIGAMCVFGWVGGAQATAPASASSTFKLDRPTTGLDDGTAGRWLGENTFQTSLVTGHDGSGPEDGRHLNLKSRTLEESARNGTPFGQAAVNLPQLGGDPLSARASIARGAVSAGWQADNNIDEASATINWQRPFVLNPFASVTFSGIATLLNTVTATPLPRFVEDSSWPDGYVHQATLIYRDESHWQNGVNLVAHIFNDDPTAPGTDLQQRAPSFDDFTYSTDPFGRLSLTVHNTSDHAMYGNFELFAYSWNALPVPEPSSLALMLAGALCVVLRLRRHRADLTRAAPARPSLS